MRWPKHISAAHSYAVNLDFEGTCIYCLFLKPAREHLPALICVKKLSGAPLWGNAHHEQLIQQGQLCFLESICSVIGNHLSLSIAAPIWVPIVFSSQSLLYLYWTIGYCSFDFLFNLLPTKWVHQRQSIWQSIVIARMHFCVALIWTKAWSHTQQKHTWRMQPLKVQRTMCTSKPVLRLVPLWSSVEHF